MNAIWAIAVVVLLEMIRRKDFYVLFVLTALITLAIGSINLFNDPNLVRYLKEICLLMIWVSSLVIAIAATARQLPAERENRTLFPLLAKPVTRGQVLLGKFVGCWLACGLALLVFYLFFGAVTASREHHWPVSLYLQGIGLHWVALGVVIALALAGSLVLSAPSANVTICFVLVVGILWLGGHLNKIALRAGDPFGSVLYAVYYVIPHLELFDIRDLIVHDWPLIAWNMWGLAVLYGGLYTGIFLLAAWLLFRRRALN